jgi:hypothetical protein
MEYSIACECGRTLPVSAGEAGSLRLCQCGKEIVIPSLRALRQAAGQPVTETPELLVKSMLHENRVPDGDECVACAVRTDDIAIVRTDCEKKTIRWSGGKDGATAALIGLLFGPLFGWLFYKSQRPDEAREIGRDLTYLLPLRLCFRCANRVRGSALKKAMRQVPLYDRLLQKYPRAILSIAMNDSRSTPLDT